MLSVSTNQINLCVSNTFFAFDSTVIGRNLHIPIRCGITELRKQTVLSLQTVVLNSLRYIQDGEV
jgi:hypothetical protein